MPSSSPYVSPVLTRTSSFGPQPTPSNTTFQPRLPRLLPTRLPTEADTLEIYWTCCHGACVVVLRPPYLYLTGHADCDSMAAILQALRQRRAAHELGGRAGGRQLLPHPHHKEAEGQWWWCCCLHAFAVVVIEFRAVVVIEMMQE